MSLWEQDMGPVPHRALASSYQETTAEQSQTAPDSTGPGRRRPLQAMDWQQVRRDQIVASKSDSHNGPAHVDAPEASARPRRATQAASTKTSPARRKAAAEKAPSGNGRGPALVIVESPKKA